VKETNRLGGINIVFKGFGVANWVYLGCDDGHIWTNGAFHERRSITCL